MARTFEELVEIQRTADAAQAQVEQLRETYGPPSRSPGASSRPKTYETAWRAWRDLARDVQAAVTEYAKEQGESRYDAEAGVKKTARHPADD